MHAEKNKETVRRIWEANNQGLEGYLSAHAEHFSRSEVLHLAGMPPMGFAEHEQLDRSLYAGFPDVRFTVHQLLADGEEVTARFSMAMTHTGEFQGVPATGKRVQVTGIAVYAFREGKVAEVWAQIDMLGLLQQIEAFAAKQVQ